MIQNEVKQNVTKTSVVTKTCVAPCIHLPFCLAQSTVISTITTVASWAQFLFCPVHSNFNKKPVLRHVTLSKHKFVNILVASVKKL